MTRQSNPQPDKSRPDKPRTETKALYPMTNELLATFQAFQEANDARLAEMERKAGADVLLNDKIDRIDRALTAQQMRLETIARKAARPGLGASPDDPGDTERKSAWNTYLRKGDESALARLELKAATLSLGTDSQGGYVVPPELDRMIETRLLRASPMRAIASVRQTSAQIFRKPVSLGAEANWVAETGTRPQTDAPSLSLLEFPAAELYALPAATQSLLDDSFVNLDEWLAEEVETAFAAQESAAFVTGDGTGRPRGFLAYPTVADAQQAWGQVGYIATGAAGAFAATGAADALISLAYAPRAQFRANGRFVMNRKTISAIRRLKDSTGAYIWQPGIAGEASTLLGYPVAEVEDMPDIAPDAFAVAFGDFARFYLIVDRQGARVLRDPFSAKPFVLFYTTKRVGGGIQHFDAVKLLRFSAA